MSPHKPVSFPVFVCLLGVMANGVGAAKENPSMTTWQTVVFVAGMLAALALLIDGIHCLVSDPAYRLRRHRHEWVVGATPRVVRWSTGALTYVPLRCNGCPKRKEKPVDGIWPAAQFKIGEPYT